VQGLEKLVAEHACSPHPSNSEGPHLLTHVASGR